MATAVLKRKKNTRRRDGECDNRRTTVKKYIRSWTAVSQAYRVTDF